MILQFLYNIVTSIKVRLPKKEPDVLILSIIPVYSAETAARYRSKNSPARMPEIRVVV